MAEPTRRPNFLFVLTDQHRPDWLGCEDKVPVRTPNIDALAARGTRFTQAHCPSPLCGPSRACLAAGVEYDACGVPNHKFDFDPARPTYYKLLRDAGYHVAVVGKIDLNKCSGDWGLDGKKHLHEWGFTAGLEIAGGWDGISYLKDGSPVDPYMLYLQQQGVMQAHIDDFRRRGNFKETYPCPLNDEEYQDSWIAARAMELMDECPTDRPWHLAVNFTGPHDPMDVTPDMHTWYRNPPVDFPPPTNTTPTAHDQEVRRNYAAKIEVLDRWLGRFVERIKERGELENTVIIFTADHGEMLGDRGQWMKSRPWWQSVKIPMIFAGPGVPVAVRNDLTNLIDVGRTILDFAGVQPSAGMVSRPLFNAPSREFIRSGLGPWRMVCDGKHKLIVGYESVTTDRHLHANPFDPDGPAMLFDVQADPFEQHDIAASRVDIVQKLRKQLI